MSNSIPLPLREVVNIWRVPSLNSFPQRVTDLVYMNSKVLLGSFRMKMLELLLTIQLP